MISRRHRKLLEEFEDVYSPQDILNTISQIKEKNRESIVSAETSDDQETINEADSTFSKVTEFISFIEGVKIRMRELHWAAEKRAEHVLTDSVLDILTKFEDEFAESCMGIFEERIKVGDIKSVLPEETNVPDLLDAITAETIDLRLIFDEIKKEDFRKYSGLLSLIDDFLQEIDKSKYLETLE